MNTKHVLSLAALAVCAALSTSALAQTNIDFKGKVVPDSCTITVNGSGTTLTIPDVTVTQMGTAITSLATNETAFNLNLTGCVPPTGTAQVNFSQAAAANGRLTNTAGTATGVSLELRSSNDSVLAVTTAPLTSPVAAGIDPGATVTSGAATVPYKVRYFNDVGNGVTPGSVEATAVATVNYL